MPSKDRAAEELRQAMDSLRLQMVSSTGAAGRAAKESDKARSDLSKSLMGAARGALLGVGAGALAAASTSLRTGQSFSTSARDLAGKVGQAVGIADSARSAIDIAEAQTFDTVKLLTLGGGDVSDAQMRGLMQFHKGRAQRVVDAKKALGNIAAKQRVEEGAEDLSDAKPVAAAGQALADFEGTLKRVNAEVKQLGENISGWFKR